MAASGALAVPGAGPNRQSRTSVRRRTTELCASRPTSREAQYLSGRLAAGREAHIWTSPRSADPLLAHRGVSATTVPLLSLGFLDEASVAPEMCGTGATHMVESVTAVDAGWLTAPGTRVQVRAPTTESTMHRGPIAGTLLLCYLAACTSWHVEKEVSPLQLISTKHPKVVRLTRAGGSRMVLDSPESPRATAWRESTTGRHRASRSRTSRRLRPGRSVLSNRSGYSSGSP